MSFTIQSASVPVFSRMLGNMLNWLETAKQHAATKNFESSVYLTLRLAPDMLPLIKQIQITSDTAKGCVARLAGEPVPSWEDNEASFDQLIDRIRRTKDFVESVPAASFHGADTRAIEIPRRTGEPLKFNGADYLNHFALPNFYFHAMATYALLRNAGVTLGKMDYLGKP